MIPFETMVRYVLKSLSKQRMDEIWKQIKAEPYHVSIAMGIRKTMEKHDLKTFDEITEWYANEELELGAMLGETLENEVTFQKLIQEVQNILNEDPINTTEYLIGDTIKLFDGDKTHPKGNPRLDIILSDLSLKDLMKLYTELNREQRISLVSEIIKTLLPKIAIASNQIQTTIDRTTLVKEINWFLLDDQESILDVRLRKAIMITFNNHFTG